jgi:Tol biopolymer transport system component
MSEKTITGYKFGQFCLDITKRRLFCDGELIPLPPKVFDLLAFLVKNQGIVLDKEDILNSVWTDTVVEEANLSVNISNLRKILGEGHHDHKYIETLPRRGYRFVCSVEEVNLTEGLDNRIEAISPVGSTTDKDTTQTVKVAQNKSLFRLSPSVIVVIVFLLLFLGGSSLIIWRYGFNRKAEVFTSFHAKLFTSLPGRESSPAFSPDGNHIAFVWDGGEINNLDIYVQLVDGSSPLRLTTNPASDMNPVWSPDGKKIAFYRDDPNSSGIYIVPYLGGAEQKLLNVFPNRYALAPRTYLSWSSDGEYIAVADKNSLEAPFKIYFVSVKTGEKRAVTTPSDTAIGDLSPSLSPDGQKLAFVRVGSAVVEDLFVMLVSGGEVTRLTFDNAAIGNPTWSPNSDELIFSSSREGIFSLWKIPTTGGKPQRIAESGLNSLDPNVANKQYRLAYSHVSSDSNIWRLELTTQNGAKKFDKQIISSSLEDMNPQYSPDGEKIVFVSDRSGNHEIWLSSGQGDKPVQLTNFHGPLCGSPRWSPDSKTIAFDSRPNGNADIFILSAEGGKPQQLTFEESEDIVPSWSNDGNWVYFASNRNGNMQVWKISKNAGPVMQVTFNGGFESMESPDGKWLYYTKARGSSAIWRIATSGGEESPVFDFNQVECSRYWTITDGGIFFATLESSTISAIKYFDFISRKAETVAVLDKRLPAGKPGLSVSPNRRWLLFPKLERDERDIIILERDD